MALWKAPFGDWGPPPGGDTIPVYAGTNSSGPLYYTATGPTPYESPKPSLYALNAVSVVLAHWGSTEAGKYPELLTFEAFPDPSDQSRVRARMSAQLSGGGPLAFSYAVVSPADLATAEKRSRWIAGLARDILTGPLGMKKGPMLPQDTLRVSLLYGLVRQSTLPSLVSTFLGAQYSKQMSMLEQSLPYEEVLAETLRSLALLSKVSVEVVRRNAALIEVVLQTEDASIGVDVVTNPWVGPVEEAVLAWRALGPRVSDALKKDKDRTGGHWAYWRAVRDMLPAMDEYRYGIVVPKIETSLYASAHLVSLVNGGANDTTAVTMSAFAKSLNGASLKAKDAIASLGLALKNHAGQPVKLDPPVQSTAQHIDGSHHSDIVDEVSAATDHGGTVVVNMPISEVKKILKKSGWQGAVRMAVEFNGGSWTTYLQLYKGESITALDGLPDDATIKAEIAPAEKFIYLYP